MHHSLRFTSSLRLRRWSLPLAALLLLIPALLAACATENTTSETVIVTGESEDVPQNVFEQEEMARQLAEEMARREELERQQKQQELTEAVDLIKIHETLEEINQGKLRRLELQMEYLRNEIRKTGGIIEGLESDGASVKTGSTEYWLAYRRLELLNEMYMRRLEQFETMKLDEFTELALREGADED